MHDRRSCWIGFLSQGNLVIYENLQVETHSPPQSFRFLCEKFGVCIHLLRYFNKISATWTFRNTWLVYQNFQKQALVSWRSAKWRQLNWAQSNSIIVHSNALNPNPQTPRQSYSSTHLTNRFEQNQNARDILSNIVDFSTETRKQIDPKHGHNMCC